MMALTWCSPLDGPITKLARKAGGPITGPALYCGKTHPIFFVGGKGLLSCFTKTKVPPPPLLEWNFEGDLDSKIFLGGGGDYSRGDQCPGGAGSYSPQPHSATHVAFPLSSNQICFNTLMRMNEKYTENWNTEYWIRNLWDCRNLQLSIRLVSIMWFVGARLILNGW